MYDCIGNKRGKERRGRGGGTKPKEACIPAERECRRIPPSRTCRPLYPGHPNRLLTTQKTTAHTHDHRSEQQTSPNTRVTRYITQRQGCQDSIVAVIQQVEAHRKRCVSTIAAALRMIYALTVKTVSARIRRQLAREDFICQRVHDDKWVSMLTTSSTRVPPGAQTRNAISKKNNTWAQKTSFSYRPLPACCAPAPGSTRRLHPRTIAHRTWGKGCSSTQRTPPRAPCRAHLSPAHQLPPAHVDVVWGQEERLTRDSVSHRTVTWSPPSTREQQYSIVCCLELDVYCHSKINPLCLHLPTPSQPGRNIHLRSISCVNAHTFFQL